MTRDEINQANSDTLNRLAATEILGGFTNTLRLSVWNPAKRINQAV
jgi:hypothetical protein